MKNSKIFKVFIGEIENRSRELLIGYISSFPYLEIKGTAKSGKEAFNKINSGHYDLLLLDTDLPGMTGIDILKKIEKAPITIFTSFYDNYAVQAYEQGVCDYLVKPFSFHRFSMAINRFFQIKKSVPYSLQSSWENGFSFREKGKYYFVSYNDIIYFSSNGDHTVIHTEERDFEICCSLKSIEAKISPDIFVRIHKQFITNIHYVCTFEYQSGGKYLIYLSNADENVLPVGRAYASQFKEKLQL